MRIVDFIEGLKAWRFTRARAIDLTVDLIAVLLYECVARPYYRPYIYSQGINDFHIADTLGNSLGTIATVFFFLFLLGGETKRDIFLINMITLSVAVYELAHPLLGKSIDPWDLAATILSGGICHLIYRSVSRISPTV